jgi:hypothetical protein
MQQQACHLCIKNPVQRFSKSVHDASVGRFDVQAIKGTADFSVGKFTVFDQIL